MGTQRSTSVPYDTALNRLYVYEGSNQTVIDPEGELKATDPDVTVTPARTDTNPGNNVADTLTYTLSGPDAGKFEDSNNDGQLEPRDPLEYATDKRAYTVTVIVRDSLLGVSLT